MPKRNPDATARADGGLSLRGSARLVQAADGDKKGRRFEIVAYTGGPLEQGGMGWMYPVIVDLEGLDTGDGEFPILCEHGPDPWSQTGATVDEYVVGQSEKAEIKDGKLTLSGPMFDVNDRAQRVIKLSDAGFKYQASIGARSLAKDFIGEGSTVEVNGRSYEGPIYVSRKTKLREVSFVAIGADDQTSALVASGKGTIMAKKMTFADYCKSKGHDEDKLDEKMKAKLKAEYDEDQEDEDDDKKGKDAKARADLDLKAAQRDAVAAIRAEAAAETARINAIRRHCAADPTLTVEIEASGVKAKVNLLEHAIAAGWDAQRVELEVLRASRPTTPVHWYAPTAPVMSEAVIEAAVLQAGRCQLDSDDFYMSRGPHGPERRVPQELQQRTQREMRARYTDQVQQAAHSHFGRYGIGLHQVLTLAARSNGYRGSDSINAGNLEEVLRFSFRGGDIRAEGASMISVQNVLANVLNKFLLAGYLYVDQSWREICATRPVKDFKPSKSVNVFGDFVFKKLNADGQIQNAAMTDEAFANQIDTFARKLGIPRQTIINDDLAAITTVPQLMGIGSADQLSLLVWTLWLSPGNGPDGNAFWFARNAAANALGGGAANSNLVPAGGSSALSSSSLQTAVQLFDKQVKPNGQPLGVEPAKLLFPPELYATAMELLTAQFLVYGGASASKQPNTNIWKDRFKPVKSPYLSNPTITGNSATAWWLLAEPTRVAAIEVAFLNGQETPTVQTAQANFNELGIDVRGFHDNGAAMQNIRAGVKSPGA